jgi:hypothetical protein
MALFGLSPLFLSVLASNFFTDPVTGLNVTRFLKFYAMMTGCVHLIGTITLRLPLVSEHNEPCIDDPEPTAEPDERSALLPSKPPNDVEVLIVPVNEHGSLVDLLRDCNFWTLFFVALVVLGSVSQLCVTKFFVLNGFSLVRNGTFQYRHYCVISFARLVPFRNQCSQHSVDRLGHINTSQSTFPFQHYFKTSCWTSGRFCLTYRVIFTQWRPPIPKKASR